MFSWLFALFLLTVPLSAEEAENLSFSELSKRIEGPSGLVLEESWRRPLEGKAFRALAAHKDEIWLAVEGEKEDEGKTFAFGPNGKIRRSFRSPAAPKALAVLRHKERTFAAFLDEGGVRVYDSLGRTLWVAETPGDGAAFLVAFEKKKLFGAIPLLAVGYRSGRDGIRAYRLEDGKVEWESQRVHDLQALSGPEHGKADRLFAMRRFGRFSFFDADGKIIKRYPTGEPLSDASGDRLGESGWHWVAAAGDQFGQGKQALSLLFFDPTRETSSKPIDHVRMDLGWASARAFVAGSFLASGLPALAAATESGFLLLFDRKGQLAAEKRLDVSIDRLAARDLDGDGLDELIAVTGGPKATLRVYRKAPGGSAGGPAHEKNPSGKKEL